MTSAGAERPLAPTGNDPHPNPSPIAMGEGLSTPKSGVIWEYLPCQPLRWERGSPS